MAVKGIDQKGFDLYCINGCSLDLFLGFFSLSFIDLDHWKVLTFLSVANNEGMKRRRVALDIPSVCVLWAADADILLLFVFSQQSVCFVFF